MTIIAAIFLVVAIILCVWMGYLYMVDIVQGHGKAHSYLFAIMLGVAAGYASGMLLDIVQAWF